MKIFIMDTIEQPQGSGWTTHKWELSRNLSKFCHEVHVMTYTGAKLDRVVSHPMKTKEKYKFSFIFKIMHIINILKVINAYNFDILYTRNVSFGLLGLFIKKIIKSKFVLELNGLFSEDWKVEKKLYSGRKMLKNIKVVLWSYLEIFVAKKADAVIAVASGIKDILIEKGINKSNITVISNGANIDLFKPIDNIIAINKLRHQYNISENDHVIIFVGNLNLWHGVQYLIKSAPLILKIFPNTKFLIVGDGQIKKELINIAEKTSVSNKFIFTGSVPYENVPIYINTSDVCVAPEIITRNDKLGASAVKIYEYLACGKPVVASNIKGIGDQLGNSGSGIFVTPEDPNELANAIIKLLKDEQLRKKMGKNGREVVVNNYSWEHTAKKTIDVFENLLK